ncbi:MAG: protein phosphatase 2C domain-containing protein [Treponema sp.]|jgi:serine/threonine protein phosphatase PrpC|nr:protein phosphatase 2C domain-containing protein [Treponema sp.]
MNACKSFAVTVTGGSHIKHGKGCEDYSCEYTDNSVAIAVVSDGHGDDNCFRSAIGAKFAAECAKNKIKDAVVYFKPKFTPESINKKRYPAEEEFRAYVQEYLVKRIIEAWLTIVEEHYTANPFTEEELNKTDEKHRVKYKSGKNPNKSGTTLTKAAKIPPYFSVYGATLIASAITPYYWLGLQIGDGRLTALYEDGGFDQPVPLDEKCFLNVTTSICDDNALDIAHTYFSYSFVKPPPVAVFLCSDGIDDNYPVEDNEKHLFKLYRTIALTFAEEGFESTNKQLIDLANQFAGRGKGDDSSIAGFINMDGLKRAAPIWKTNE